MPGAEAGPTTRGLRLAGRFLLRVPVPLAALLVGGWGFLIWDLSSQHRRPPLGASLLWEWLSNLAHAPLFGILTLFLAGLLLRERGGGWPRACGARHALVFALVLAYGLLDEWHQSRIPGRDASLLDVLTDAVSSGLVLWIVGVLAREPLREQALLARLALGVLLCAASAALACLS